MIKNWFYNNKQGLKWIGISFLIKIPLFVFFAYNFQQNRPPSAIFNGIFVAHGDTWGYYDPCENFVKGMGYTSYCRMPGLLPIYYLFRLFFDTIWTKTIIILLQFITSTISVYVLALIAKKLFKSERVFKITFYLYAISSFVSIWDHIGYSDSFGISFLIFSVYYLVKSKETNSYYQLFISGAFLTWSIFFRPVHGISIPFFILIYIFDYKNIIQSIKKGIVYMLPFLIFISIWINHNYKITNKIIILQGPSEECFPGITKEMLVIRDLITAWGGDIQPWSLGSAGQWFFDKRVLKTGL